MSVDAPSVLDWSMAAIGLKVKIHRPHVSYGYSLNTARWRLNTRCTIPKQLSVMGENLKGHPWDGLQGQSYGGFGKECSDKLPYLDEMQAMMSDRVILINPNRFIVEA